MSSKDKGVFRSKMFNDIANILLDLGYTNESILTLRKRMFQWLWKENPDVVYHRRFGLLKPYYLMLKKIKRKDKSGYQIIALFCKKDSVGNYTCLYAERNYVSYHEAIVDIEKALQKK